MLADVIKISAYALIGHAVTKPMVTATAPTNFEVIVKSSHT